MGRKLMRVPMDFNWPLNKTWGGYLNPYYKQNAKCADCDGSGLAPRACEINEDWYNHNDANTFDPEKYGVRQVRVDDPVVVEFATHNVKRSPEYYGPLTAANIQREARRLWALWKNQWCHHLNQADVDALVEEGRLMDFTRRPINEAQVEKLKEQEKAGGSQYWLDEPNGYKPTADEVNSWSMQGIAHDAINQMICLKARCKREGVPYLCATCNGSGNIWPSPEIEKACEDWEPTEPPTGPGYQLWETTSEGSPQSPVFATLDELCEYAAAHCSTFGSFKASAEDWRKMLDDGLVCHQNDHEGWRFSGGGLYSKPFRSYSECVMVAKSEGHEIDNAGWLHKMLMWNWHSHALDGYPGWELDGPEEYGRRHPAFIKLTHVSGKGASSDKLCNEWDDIATVDFYQRDWTDDGIPFVHKGDTYWSGWWFATVAERDRFVKWAQEKMK